MLQSERNLRLHVVADTIRKLQLYMAPIMMSFHDGNHHFLQSILEVMGCDAVDVLPETNIFFLPEPITLAAMPMVPQISYNIYDVSNIHVSSSQMTAEQMQSFSKLIFNKRLEQTKGRRVNFAGLLPSTFLRTQAMPSRCIPAIILVL